MAEATDIMLNGIEPSAGPAEAGSAADAVNEAGNDASHNVLGLRLDIDIGSYLPEWLQPFWSILQDYPLLALLIMASLGYLVGKALQVILHNTLDRLVSATETEFDDRLIKYLTAPLLQTVVTLFLIIATLAVNLPDLMEKSVIRLLVSLLLLFWARAWFKATHFVLETLSRHEEHGKVFHVRTLPLYRMGIKLLLLGGFIYLFMAVWGINATAWLASAGIIGLAVGFAARDTLANLISGVSIVADAPYKIGDYIVLDTGERGIVMNLGLRSTRLLTRDDVEISIPNAVIGNAKITNESGGPWVKHRVRLPVGVAYGSDTEKVVRVLAEVARDNDHVSEHPAPRVRMRAFGDSSLNFELLAWVPRPEQRGVAVHELLMEIDRRFRAEDIQIPFPQRDIHFPDRAAAPDAPQPESG